MKKKLIYLLLIIAHISLYFTRDFVFKNINYQIKYLQLVKAGRYKVFNYTHSALENSLTNYSVVELTTLKWILTVVCVMLFFSLSFLLMKTFLGNVKEAFQLSALLYVAFLILGGLAYFIFDYRVSREIMGIPQSPIASLILITAVKFLKK